MQRTTTREDYSRRVGRVLTLLEQRLDDPPAPQELARAAAFSLHHFHRIFKAETGESIALHTRRLRLERAARKLRIPGARILDVALEAGYESHEAFTRAFTERFALTPSAFREQPSARLQAWTSTQQAPFDASRVTVGHRGALHVASMRHRGSYRDVGVVWQKLVLWAGAHGLLGKEPTLYGLCPDDPEVTATEHLRFDACVLLTPASSLADPEIAQKTIPEGTYATLVHQGPYTTLNEGYFDLIGRWFPSSGYEPAADDVVEHYLNDPQTTAEQDLRTEIRVRIA